MLAAGVARGVVVGGELVVGWGLGGVWVGVLVQECVLEAIDVMIEPVHHIGAWKNTAMHEHDTLINMHKLQ